jgi:uncharacterized membrane protein YcgQ (UPF0703/DUF1980 family)
LWRRLVLQVGVEHGLDLPSSHVRLVWLREFPETESVVEATFYFVLLCLVGEIIYTWVQLMRSTETRLEESIAVARYELQYEILRQAAFKDIFAYRPRILFELVAKRLAMQPVTEDGMHRSIGKTQSLVRFLP